MNFKQAKKFLQVRGENLTMVRKILGRGGKNV
jgi:hypothetical protein